MSTYLNKILKSEKGIKDLLIEMKDLSELSVDLAYSALLYNSKDIAKEVIALEEQVDDLKMQVEARCMLACPGPQGMDTLIGSLRISGFIDKVTDAARSMAEMVLGGTETSSFVSEVFRETEETIAKFPVSRLAKSTVEEVEDKTGAVIIAVKRKNRWEYGPSPAFVLSKDDILIVVGTKEDLRNFKTFNRA